MRDRLDRHGLPHKRATVRPAAATKRQLGPEAHGRKSLVCPRCKHPSATEEPSHHEVEEEDSHRPMILNQVLAAQPDGQVSEPYGPQAR